MSGSSDYESAPGAWEAGEADAEPMEHPDVAAEEAAREARAADFDEAAEPIGSLLGQAFDLMDRRASGLAVPIPMPWPEVNDAMGGGLWPGFHVLSGTTGSGKSQWALQVAYEAAKAGHPVLYVGLELGHDDMVARLAGLALADDDPHAPPWSSLYLGRNPVALRAAKAKAGLLESLPFRLEVGPPNGWWPGVLSGRVAALCERHPEPNGRGSRPPLVVIDYLQIVGAEPDPSRPGHTMRQDLRERIGRAAYAARQVARDHGAVVLALSSVSRENARMLGFERAATAGRLKGKDADTWEGLGNGDPGRFVGLGKESGEIEFSADSVLVLARGEDLEDPKRSEAYLAIAKLRARPSGEDADRWRVLHFNGGWFTSEDPDSKAKRADRGAKTMAEKEAAKEAAKAEKAAKAEEKRKAKAAEGARMSEAEMLRAMGRE